MTDKRTTEYLEKLGKTGLSSDALLRMRDELGSYADFHAVRVVLDERSIVEVQRNSVFTLFTHSKIRIMKATLLLALLLGTGGTSFAAQGAVPGDFLYPVKVHVNENVRSSLALGADAEARVQAKFLEERLEEAEKLAAEGKLEGEMAADVNVGITAQLQKTLAAGAEADAQTNTEVKTAVSGALSAFTADLQNMDTKISADVLSDLGAGIRTHAEGLLDAEVGGALGIELAGEITVESIVQQARTRLQALQNTITAAADMDAKVQADFKAKLEVAGEFVADAEAKLSADAQAQAQAAADKAHEILGSIESALSLMGQVEIDPNTGHIIDIDLGGSASGSSGGGASGNAGSGINLQTESIIDAGASLGNDMIYTDPQIDAAVDAAGSLGL